MNQRIQVNSYIAQFQQGVDELKMTIYKEFNLPLSPSSFDPNLFQQYWVAIENDVVIGSIALITKNEYAVLKRMFLKKIYRGKEKGMSALLLKTATDWCSINDFKTIYLGTMEQFKAAQIFYEKNGFKKISKSLLPSDFPLNPLDTIFYQLNLN